MNSKKLFLRFLGRLLFGIAKDDQGIVRSDQVGHLALLRDLRSLIALFDEEGLIHFNEPNSVGIFASADVFQLF